MLVKHRKSFSLGIALTVSYAVVWVIILSPIFGGKTGLQYSDDMFNKLAKGSSYFIPKIAEKAQAYNGSAFSLEAKLKKPELAEQAILVATRAGARAVDAGEGKLAVSGDLGAFLAKALADSDAMYKNDGKAVADRYGMDEKEVMDAWWQVLAGMAKAYQKEKKVAELEIVNMVAKKAVEPGYNFYGIEAQKVSDRAFGMTSLLVFYVLYTLWWGYAIFYLFDGIGLSMKKAKTKKEV